MEADFIIGRGVLEEYNRMSCLVYPIYWPNVFLVTEMNNSAKCGIFEPIKIVFV